jgi:hypothetical protein
VPDAEKAEQPDDDGEDEGAEVHDLESLSAAPAVAARLPAIRVIRDLGDHSPQLGRHEDQARLRHGIRHLGRVIDAQVGEQAELGGTGVVNVTADLGGTIESRIYGHFLLLF